MKTKRKTYDGFFKAQAVSEFINGKRSLKEVAGRYGVHPNQIKNWKAILLKEACRVLDDKRRIKVASGETIFRDA